MNAPTENPDIWPHIASFLDAKSLVNLTQVNKGVRQDLNHNSNLNTLKALVSAATGHLSVAEIATLTSQPLARTLLATAAPRTTTRILDATKKNAKPPSSIWDPTARAQARDLERIHINLSAEYSPQDLARYLRTRNIKKALPIMIIIGGIGLILSTVAGIMGATETAKSFPIPERILIGEFYFLAVLGLTSIPIEIALQFNPLHKLTDLTIPDDEENKICGLSKPSLFIAVAQLSLGIIASLNSSNPVGIALATILAYALIFTVNGIRDIARADYGIGLSTLSSAHFFWRTPAELGSRIIAAREELLPVLNDQHPHRA